MGPPGIRLLTLNEISMSILHCFSQACCARWFALQMWSSEIRQRNACSITKTHWCHAQSTGWKLHYSYFSPPTYYEMQKKVWYLQNPATFKTYLETNAAKRGLLAELSADKETSDDPSAGRRRSWIWSHFELMDGSARCRLCSENLQACKGGSTGNMHRHMSAKHPEVFKPTLTHSSMKRLSGNELYICAHPHWLIPLFRICVN